MTSIRIEPATAAPWADVEFAFTGGGEGSECWCQYFLLDRDQWKTMPHDEMRSRLETQLSTGGLAPGLVTYVDDVAAGWVRVGPRLSQPRLATTEVITHSVEPLDASDVWAVTCFIVREEFRGKGVATALAAAAVAHATSHGGRLLESYPLDTARTTPDSADDLFMGSVSIFAGQGFTEVARPSEDRVVMSREL